MGLELGCLLMVSRCSDLQILALEQVRYQVFNLLGFDHLRVHVEELEVNGRIAVLVEEEVTVGCK